MKITERRLRSIIRSVIMEADSSDPSRNPIFDPIEPGEFGEDEMMDQESLEGSRELDIIDADDIPQLDHAPMSRGDRDMRDFMSRNRRAGAERDRGISSSYATRGHVHPSQLDMLSDMGELGDYSEYEQ